jgi:hypothetical protein
MRCQQIRFCEIAKVVVGIVWYDDGRRRSCAGLGISFRELSFEVVEDWVECIGFNA